MSRTRSGTILIIVAGISSLMAMMALAFLVRMRSDSEESRLFLAETQARVMLTAALNYIGETSRIGWDDPLTTEHEEAYGWVDIRDGRPGPRDRTGRMLFQTEIDPVLGKGRRWPAVGSWMVCDARLWNRPPTAISPNLVLNPIKQDPSLSWAILINFGERDPKPLAADWGSFIAGDKSVLPGTDNPCWFRVYRRKPAVFIIACGAGSSGGYQSWAEVEAAGQGSRWGSQEVWETIRMGEPRLWYEVEWNAGVNTASTGYIYSGNDSIVPTNISKTFGNGTDHPNKRNQMGTFLYLQRLEREPDIW